MTDEIEKKAEEFGKELLKQPLFTPLAKIIENSSSLRSLHSSQRSYERKDYSLWAEINL